MTAVYQRLSDEAGLGYLMLADGANGFDVGWTMAERAQAVAEIAGLGVGLAIETATRSSRKIWRAMTPASGAAATVFHAHAMAEITAQIASVPGDHLSGDRQREVRGLLMDTYPWSDAEDGHVSEIARMVDPHSGGGDRETAFVAAASRSIRYVVGDTTDRLAGFAALTSGDPAASYEAGLAWRTCWNHTVVPYLELTDPDGVGASRSVTDGGA